MGLRMPITRFLFLSYIDAVYKVILLVNETRFPLRGPSIVGITGVESRYMMKGGICCNKHRGKVHGLRVFIMAHVNIQIVPRENQNIHRKETIKTIVN